MASYIAIFLCLVCLILLSILLIRFKKLFSTDAIIDKTRNQMDKMIKDINNQSSRNIELINESTKRIRALINESDKKMEQFKQATDILRGMIALVEEKNNSESIFAQNPNISKIKTINNQKKEKQDIINPDNTYKVKQIQGSLFEDEFDNNKPKSIFNDEVKVTQEGAAYKEVPVINHKLFNEKPVINKTEKEGKKLNENIVKLFNQGYQVEQIAKELSCSVAEVQLIIDML